MKRLMRAVGAFCVAASLSASVSATVFSLKAKGVVSSMQAIDGSTGNTVAMPGTSIALGDAFTLSATFDTSTASLDPFWNADPSINVYYLSGMTQLTVGGYSDDFQIGGIQTTLQLQNDVANGTPTDGQLYELLRFGAQQATLPIDMGDGFITQGVYFHAFDPTGTARSNDLISDLQPLSEFSDQQFFLTFYNSDTNLFVQFTGTVSDSSLAAVPEASSWAMMLTGFGLIGAGMRARRRTVAVHFG